MGVTAQLEHGFHCFQKIVEFEVEPGQVEEIMIFPLRVLIHGNMWMVFS